MDKNELEKSRLKQRKTEKRKAVSRGTGKQGNRLREQATKGVEAAPVKNKPTGPRKRSPMEKERVLSTMKSKAQEMGGNVRSGDEMKAATEGLDTLTNKGPGKLKLALRGGGRAYNKNS